MTASSGLLAEPAFVTMGASRFALLAQPQRSSRGPPMKFIEFTGKTLSEIVNDDELSAADFESAGITPHDIVRVNEHGDIEVRRPAGWDVVGGLLGEYGDRVRKHTGMEWA